MERQPNQGPAVARNRALGLVTGHHVTMLDADDLMVPGRLAFQLGYLRDHPEADAVMGTHRNQVGEGVEPPDWLTRMPDPAVTPHYLVMTIMARAELFERIGGFDPSYAYAGEDTEWYLRAVSAGARIDKVDVLALRRRLHGANLTMSSPASIGPMFRMLRDRVARSRRRAMSSSGRAPGEPAVSVVVPVFDGARYLEQTLDSIVGQTHAPLELVVVDDGSTDESATIAERYVGAGQLIRQANQGIGRARNVGLAAARCPMVALCDADDVWEPDKLEVQLAHLRDHPELSVVFCGVREFLSPDLDPAEVASRAPRQLDVGPCPSGLLASRQVLEEIGPFDETLVVGEWFDWYARLGRLGVGVGSVPGVYVHRRIHLTNNSLRRLASRREYLEVLRGHLSARRDPEAAP